MTTIHVAGSYDQDTHTQFCVRCGAQLAWPNTWRNDIYRWDATRQQEVYVRTDVSQSPGRKFPEGALVEISIYGRSMAIGRSDGPTCVATHRQQVA